MLVRYRKGAGTSRLSRRIDGARIHPSSTHVHGSHKQPSPCCLQVAVRLADIFL